MGPPAITILGGGISGLTLAHYLRQALGPAARLTIVEASDRLGGWVQTVEEKGFLFERGPRSFRPSMSGAELLRLTESLGLAPQAIAPAPGGSARMIWLDGAICPLPSSLAGALFGGNPAMAGVPLAALRELFVPRSGLPDESIHDFVSRRFGEHAATTLLDPMVSGIYSGDTKKLSVRSCFGVLHEAEKSSGSVVRALLKKQLAAAAAGGGGGDGEGAGAAASDFEDHMGRQVSVSFERGMQTLTDELEARARADPNTELLTQTRAVAMHQQIGGAAAAAATATAFAAGGTGGVQLELEGEGARGGRAVRHADHVFTTIPAPALGSLVQDDSAAGGGAAAEAEAARVREKLASDLHGIEYSSVAVVNLGYERGVLQEEGFGFLVPSNQADANVLGVTFDSSCFAQQNRTPWQTRLTVMAGGAHRPEIAGLSQAALEELAIEAVRHHLRIEAAPDIAIAGVAHQAIPQYRVGHWALAEGIEQGFRRLYGGSVTPMGNWLRGVGISDCVANARGAADDFAAAAGVQQAQLTSLELEALRAEVALLRDRVGQLEKANLDFSFMVADEVGNAVQP
jgi:oxygen-dependent protoporphyrinogen oxidase